MPKARPAPVILSPDHQHAALTVQLGKRSSLTLDIAVSDRGLLAVGALVSSILVSTALIVHVARRPINARRETALPPPV